jgi:hypothetical protein
MSDKVYVVKNGARSIAGTIKCAGDIVEIRDPKIMGRLIKEGVLIEKSKFDELNAMVDVVEMPNCDNCAKLKELQKEVKHFKKMAAKKSFFGKDKKTPKSKEDKK